jgi:hypothetical protein
MDCGKLSGIELKTLRILLFMYEGFIWFSTISGFRQNVLVSPSPLVVVDDSSLIGEHGANGGAEWTR